MKLSGLLMGVPQSMCKKFCDVWSTGTGDMGPEILYFDELFQRNWKHLSIKLESPTLLQSMLYNIDIYIQLDILTYKAPKQVPMMTIWVSQSHPSLPVYSWSFSLPTPEKICLPVLASGTQFFLGNAPAEDPNTIGETFKSHIFTSYGPNCLKYLTHTLGDPFELP